MDGTKPPHPDHLRHPASVVAIRLHRHRPERGLHVPSFDQDDRQCRRRQSGMQPLRQGICLKSYSSERQTTVSEERDQRLRLAGYGL